MQVEVIASVAVAAIVLLLVAAAVCWRRRRAGKALPDADYEEKKLNPTMQPSSIGWPQDIDQAFVHSRSHLQLESTPLGSGNFGVVHEGDLELSCGAVVKVAVKKLQSTSFNDPNIAREAKIMIKLRSCHVVRSYGVVAEPDNLLLVLEYMALGDLHTFLRKKEAPDDDILTKLEIKQVVGMAAQVADGMLYLSSHRIVHRDLAARNCLLDEHGNVKVSDFGLSRPIETDSRDFYQTLDCRREIPFRSMPPEFLERGVFSFQSDVWSYGVLLWEILRAGAVPYGDLPNDKIQSSVKMGINLLQGSLPPSCPPFLERLMVQCWNFYPEDRPSFRTIIAALLPTLMEHSPKFLKQFGKDAFYYTLETKDDIATLVSRPGNCHVSHSPLSAGIIPPAPQIPLPPLPCPLPSTSAINISRPTSLRIISSFSARARDATHVSVSMDQQEGLEHNRADRLDPSSPDAASPTSTVSTLLSPAPLAISEEICDYPRPNQLLEQIKTGFSYIPGPLDTIRSTYSRMNLVRIKEKEVKFYSNTNSVHDEATYVGQNQEDGSMITRALQSLVFQLEDPLPQGDSFYQDMNSATKRQLSTKPEVYEQFESTLMNIPKPSLTDSVVDDAVYATDVAEFDHDNSTNVESPSTLVDPEEDLDDTLDARDMLFSSDSLHRKHHSGDNPSRTLIANLGIETPPPSRNNSVGSNQA